jgi:hemolysin type calcium-binding protein
VIKVALLLACGVALAADVTCTVGKRCSWAPLITTSSTAPTRDGIAALGGNDTVYAHGGNDGVKGVHGDDVVEGNEGDDRVDGREGEDKRYGGLGTDLLQDFLDYCRYP